MFVQLELSWLEHPFAFNSFVVSAEDIAIIQGLGLTQVRIDPLRSKAALPPKGALPSPVPAGSRAGTGAAMTPEKEARIEQNRVLRQSLVQAERHAAAAAAQVRQTTKLFFADPPRAVEGTGELVGRIAQTLLTNSDAIVHLVGSGGEEVYYHSLNVTMLALLLGKALGHDAEMLRMVGLAAVFHDIGKEDMPSRVLLKTDPWTPAEQELVRQHVEKGAALAARAGLPPTVVAAILQHHEHLDGSGYPNCPAADRIGTVSRVLAIVNHYDNLCNPINAANAQTPYEALSTMFAKRKNWFDGAMLGKLVQILGVYPPGSIVRLSNGATGMVVSVNSARPLKPMVLVHDPSIPKAEAVILDLDKEAGLLITKALRPASLAPSVFDYLSPRQRTTYYFGDAAAR